MNLWARNSVVQVFWIHGSRLVLDSWHAVDVFVFWPPEALREKVRSQRGSKDATTAAKWCNHENPFIYWIYCGCVAKFQPPPCKLFKTSLILTYPFTTCRSAYKSRSIYTSNLRKSTVIKLQQNLLSSWNALESLSPCKATHDFRPWEWPTFFPTWNEPDLPKVGWLMSFGWLCLLF